MTKGNILIIDDEEPMVNSLKFLLTLEKFKVQTALNGKEGLSLILSEENSNPFDLIITDIWMPELTGIELLNELNKMNIYIPVIFITAMSEIDIVKETKQASISEFINKPFDDETLLFKIANILKNI